MSDAQPLPDPESLGNANEGTTVDPDDQDDADFATEHDSPTFADQMPGGPEQQTEDDVPRGLAGAD